LPVRKLRHRRDKCSRRDCLVISTNPDDLVGKIEANHYP